MIFPVFFCVFLPTKPGHKQGFLDALQEDKHPWQLGVVRSVTNSDLTVKFPAGKARGGEREVAGVLLRFWWPWGSTSSF